MPKLFVMHHATCARKALFTALEKKAALPTVEVERGDLTTPEFRAMNPDGLVPTLLLDDGTALVESSIIMRYIDEAFEGGALQPNDPVARSQMNLWMKFIDERYFPGLGAPTMATFMRRMFGTPPDEPRLQAMLASVTDHTTRVMREDSIRKGLASGFVEAGLRRLSEMLDRMEVTLGRFAWLAGDELTLADCAMVPIVLRLDEFGLSAAWSDRKEVSRWWRQIRGRPAIQQLLDMADQTLLAEITGSVVDARDHFLARLS